VREVDCWEVGAYLVVRLDVQLDLFAGEGADSGGLDVSWLICGELKGA
jgi:hypothetical protein